MISISAMQSDIDGNIVLVGRDLSYDSLMSLHDLARRGKRVPTLDGKAVMIDTGISVSDLTLKLTVVRKIQENIDILKHIARSHRYVVVCTEIAAFKGVLSKLQGSNGGYAVEILVLEQLSD